MPKAHVLLCECKTLYKDNTLRLVGPEKWSAMNSCFAGQQMEQKDQYMYRSSPEIGQGLVG